MDPADSYDNGQESVGEVASRLRVFEDFNLAFRLQDQEFGQHYASNRAERQLVGSDTKKSRKEQEHEARVAALRRQQELNLVAANDARVALMLQKQLEKEEKLQKERIAQLDADFARSLEIRERQKLEQRHRASIEAADEQYARDLQEYYNSRSRKNYQKRDAPPKKPSILPSFITKPKKQHRNGPETAQPLQVAEPREHVSWGDTVDERTQNEVNSQMVSAANVRINYGDPPPAYSALDHSSSYGPNPDYPLATIATRDSSSPSYAERSLPGNHSRFNGGLVTELAAANPRLSRSAIEPPLSPSVYQQCSVPRPYCSGSSRDVLQNPILMQQNQCDLPSVTANLSTSVVSATANTQPSQDNNNNLRISAPRETLVTVDSNIINRLHPTNPFLVDLVQSAGNAHPSVLENEGFPPPPSHLRQSTTFVYNDEFGLPPPSAFAMGNTS